MQPSPDFINSRIAGLIRKHLLEQISPVEAQELENWIEADALNKQHFISISTSFASGKDIPAVALKKTRVSVLRWLPIMVIILSGLMFFAWKMGVHPKSTKEPTISIDSSKSYEAPGVKIDSLIVFKQATVQNIMSGISHHYQIPVVYRGKIPQSTYSAKIHRTMPVREMIKLLNLVGIHAQYDGKQIIVME